MSLIVHVARLINLFNLTHLIDLAYFRNTKKQYLKCIL